MSSYAPDPPSKRAAVWHTSTSGRRAVATLTISEVDEEIKATIAADETNHLEPLKALLVGAISSRTKPATLPDAPARDRLTLDAGLALLCARLKGSGYELEEIPDADVQMELTQDLLTGEVVATARSLNPAKESGTLARDIAQRVAGVLPAMSREALLSIEAAAACGDAGQIVEALQGASLLLSDEQEKVGDLLAQVDPEGLEPAAQQIFYEHLVRGSVQHPARLESAINRLLRDHRESLSPERIASYKLVLADAIARQGGLESALQAWRELSVTEGREFPHIRAGALFAIATVLEPSDPDAARNARMAADAFLECGKRQPAAQALVNCARYLFHSDVSRGLAVLEEAEVLFGLDEAFDRHSRAGLLHLRASMHLDMANAAAALRDATEAVRLREGLLQVEPAQHATLLLAADAARQLGDSGAETEFRGAAAQLRAAAPHVVSPDADDVALLLHSYDPATAKRVLDRAAAEGDRAAPSIVRLLRSIADKSLTAAERLRECEAAAAELDASPRRGDKELGLLAVAQELIDQGDLPRAARWYARIVAENPVSQFARQQYAALLGQTSAWAELAKFAAGEIRRFGPAPGRACCHGRALLELGDANAALRELQSARALVAPGTPLAAEIDRWREEALTRGAAEILAPRTLVEQRLVSASDLQAKMAEFARFVANEKRAQFWRLEDREHKWTSSPERLAKSELHTFLKASFGEAIETLEEVSSGAGRVDLYVILNSGSRVVVELKMCGNGYSSSYAFEGTEQIAHYMTNRGTAVGFLVIFDSRARDYGKGLAAVEKHNNQTVYVNFVDVRPLVKQRKP